MGKALWIIKAGIILGLTVSIFGSAGYFAYQLFIVPNRVPPREAGVARTPPPDPSLPDLAEALKLKSEHKPLEARAALEAFLDNHPFSSKLDVAKKALGELNIEIFFSPVPSPEKIRYEVQRGDALIKIERKLNTSRELLMRVNKLEDPRRLSIGQVLYVSPADFSVVIDRRKQTVTLFNGHRFFKEYAAVEWHAPAPKKGAEKIPITAKVRNKVAWFDGGRVAFGSKEYDQSTRWVELTASGFTLYTQGGPKPQGGIAIDPAGMEELSTLLSKNVPVSIQ